MTTEATEIKDLVESKCDKTTTELYYGIMREAIGKDILDFTDEGELYNAVMNAKRKAKHKYTDGIVKVPKYITQSFLNMCILLRESKGLTTNILKGNKLKEVKEQKANNANKPPRKHTLEIIESFVNKDTGDKVKDAIRYIINFLRFNINDKEVLKDLYIGKLWSNIDTSGDMNMLVFADEKDNTPKQVFYFNKKENDYNNIIPLNCEKLFDSIKIIWDYAVINKNVKNYCKEGQEEVSNLPFYFEILEQVTTTTTKAEKQKLITDYVLSHSYHNWLLGAFNAFIKKNDLLRGDILCNKKISDNTHNWGFGADKIKLNDNCDTEQNEEQAPTDKINISNCEVVLSDNGVIIIGSNTD